MPIETFGFISDLNENYPVPADGLLGGDDHLRGIKSSLKATFPNISGAASVTHTTLSKLQSGSVGYSDGTYIAPPIFFNSDTGLGFYRKSSATIGFTGRLYGVGAKYPGELFFHSGDVAPPGSYACDGQEVSRTDDAALFAEIGTKYGAGNGSTTFNLPNAKNRFPRHRDAAGNAGVVGTVLGWLLGAHTHAGSGTTSSGGNHYHAVSAAGYTNAAGNHNHLIGSAVLAGGGYGGSGLQVYIGVTPSYSSDAGEHQHYVSLSGSSDYAGSHDHTFSFNTASVGGVENRPNSISFLLCIQR